MSLAADELGDVLLNMLSIAGIPIDKIGLSDREDVDVLKGSVLADPVDVGVPLKEPVKVGMDVDSPDFSYDDFHYNDHDPNVYAPEVERERTKYAEERSNGLIATRLRGEG